MNEQKSLPTDLVVALDIGTTKVCAIAGRKNEHGKLEILGIGKVESVGVMRGVVTNIEKTVNAATPRMAPVNGFIVLVLEEWLWQRFSRQQAMMFFGLRQ